MNVIITGATKGIGRAIAELLLEEGANMAICARSQTDIHELVKLWKDQYPERLIIGKSCDMGVRKDIDDFADYVQSEMDSVEVLVNNAGLFIPGEILKEKDDSLEQMIRINLYSAYHFTRQIAPLMIDAGKGHIFNMCSIASQIAYPNGGSYSIAKFALLGFSKVLREELKPKGVKVTAILPGATWSNSWSGVDLPRERLMEARDIAIAVSSALKMSPSAVVEDIVIRPQLGDL